MDNLIKPILFLICVLMLGYSYSQDTVKISCYIDSELDNKYIKSIAQEFKLNSSHEIANKIWLSFIKNGYINARIDSIIMDSLNHKIYFNKREPLDINFFQISNQSKIEKLEDPFLNLKGKHDLTSLYNKLFNIIETLNNNGYPFALVNISNSRLDNNQLTFNYEINKGPMVYVDSVINPEMEEKQLKLLKKIINIKSGSLFDISKIQQVETLISKVNYIKSLRPPAYEFINDKAIIYTYLKMKSFNNINGIIGIQPDNNGTIQFTGNVSLDLNNNLNFGENFQFKWRRMFNASQNLITSFSVPYLFSSNFQINGNLNMIKKDTSFFNFDADIDLSYIFGVNSQIGITANRLLSTNIQQVEYNYTSTNNFGFFLQQNQLNNNLNPSRGWKLNAAILTGTKQTFFNSNDDMVRTPNLSINIDYEHYLKIKNRVSLKLKAKVNSISNDQLYENELTRIGGYNSIRGFDEESIWVSSYAINTTELRYLLDNESSVFIFNDIAWTEKNITLLYEKNWIRSFGFGTHIGFKNGLLSLMYGLGTEVGQPFLIRTGKIHLGFTSYF